MTRLRWSSEPTPASRRPYRDAAVLYAVLGAIVVLVAALTGGGLVRAFAFGIGFFVIATGYTWLRLRRRERGTPPV